MLEDFYQKDEIQIQNFDLFCKVLPNNYLICHFLMIFSFILRCQRILACCNINTDERTEVELFYKNRYKFKERYYIKILFFLMCIVTFLNLMLNLQFENLILIPYHFKKCIKNDRISAFDDRGNFDMLNLEKSNFDKLKLNDKAYASGYNNDIDNHDNDINGLSNINYNFNSSDKFIKLKFLQSEIKNINKINANAELNNASFNKKLKNDNKKNSIENANNSHFELNTYNFNSNSSFDIDNKLNNQINPSTSNKINTNYNDDDSAHDKLNSEEWIIVNFIEHIILVTYSYFLGISPIKQLIKLELTAFFGVWIIYPNFLRFSQFYLQEENPQIIEISHWTSYVCVFFLYLCLIINGFIPIVASYLEEKKLNYHFIPKLANNLYLFLSNELCFFSFNDFLIKSEAENIENFSINSRSPMETNAFEFNSCKTKGLFFLRLYTDIMTYKLSYSLEPDDNKVLANARVIYEYFSNSNKEISGGKLDKFFDVEVINNTKSYCLILNQGKFEYEMFDESLALTFKSLYEMFLVYRRSEEFQVLVDNLMVNSYIHCKMYNTGLINKF
jgi:hypothetical protein